jgi:5-methyltetrahydrofolate--homocysteine methyltransferase
VDIFKQISESLQKGDVKSVTDFTKTAINDHSPPKEILDRGLIAGMNVIGEKFRNREIFLPEVLIAARAMHAGIELLKPLLIMEGVASRGKIILGTVKGDLHDIGKNLVGIMLKGAGYEVIDLGKDVSPEIFVGIAVQENARVIGMSALLTTTMSSMQDVIDLLSEKKLNGSIKTIVGGAPVSEKFAREIGAHSYAKDATAAVDQVNKLIMED